MADRRKLLETLQAVRHSPHSPSPQCRVEELTSGSHRLAGARVSQTLLGGALQEAPCLSLILSTARLGFVRCIKSMHLFEPLELAIVARAFDVHEPGSDGLPATGATLLLRGQSSGRPSTSSRLLPSRPANLRESAKAFPGFSGLTALTRQVRDSRSFARGPSRPPCGSAWGTSFRCLGWPSSL